MCVEREGDSGFVLFVEFYMASTLFARCLQGWHAVANAYLGTCSPAAVEQQLPLWPEAQSVRLQLAEYSYQIMNTLNQRYG